MTPYEVAITVIAVASILFNIYQADQAKKQRRMDYLHDQQKELRQQKAEYDGWEPVWDKWEKGNNPARHGAKVCSIAQSVMLAVNDSTLTNLARDLKLYPKIHEDVEQNQEILIKATARLAKLLDENWVSENFREAVS